VSDTDEAEKDFRTGSLMALSMVVLMPLGLLIVLTGIEGVSPFANVTRYVAIPIGVVVGPLLAWRAWKALRAKDYMYVDKDGDTVQREPGVAALQAIFMACVLAVVVSFGVQAVFRFAVKVLPGTPVAFQSHVTSLGSGRSCHIEVEYADTITSGSVRVCSEIAPGKRWVGEPVTVHETVGAFGAKLDRLSFDDAYSGMGRNQ
jgi:hypothetical protein